MAHYTKLEHEDLTKLCRRYGLGELVEFQSIAAGTINSNYRVVADSGTYFLRVNEGKVESEVRFETGVLEHLVAKKVPTLLPLKAERGERFTAYQERFISVFPWRVGYHCSAKNISHKECKAIGTVLAQLHSAGADMPCATRGRYPTEAIYKVYESYAASTDPNLAESIAVLAKEFSWLQARKETREQLPSGLIHADLFPDNVLLDQSGIAALLDFEQACHGAYVYDLAVCCNAWCFDDVALVPERFDALIAGYLEERSMDESTLAGLETELRASAVRFLVTRIRDIYLPAQASSETALQGKDFRRFLMRLKTWHGFDFSRLADLSARCASL